MSHQLRRAKVMESIGNGIAIIPTSPSQRRNADVHYPYRPDSDFYYLTHFDEPESVAVLAPGSEHGDYILFCRETDPEKERWDGSRAGLTGAVETYQADTAFSISSIDEMMPLLMKGRDQIHSCIGRYRDFDSAVIRWLTETRNKIRSGIATPDRIVDISRTIHELRMFKQADEIEKLEFAAEISAQAHKAAMHSCHPGGYEFEIQAEIEYWFRSNNCDSAYPSIVAAGANACTLHYVENSKELEFGELLLIDAGAEFDCYAADITRTFPISGQYSSEQKLVYEVVLEAQRKAIEAAVPGNRYSDVNDAATEALTEGLVELKIIDGPVSDAIETRAYARYYMHKVGHWLGIDVHDVGAYCDPDERSRQLKPGMYMTVEPGLYLSASDDLDERWHDIGIRIEDDVLITDMGNRVLTETVPKSVSDIEALMSGHDDEML